MLSLPTRITFILTSTLFITVVLSQNQDFMNWLLSSPETGVKVRPPQQRKASMIAPKPEKAPERARPKPRPPKDYQSAPEVSKGEKKARPIPPKSKKKKEFVAKAQIQLRDKLSEKEEVGFKKRVARGEKLKAEGIDAPVYLAAMKPWMIDHLWASGRIKLFVTCTKRPNSFVFTGGLSRPGEVHSISDIKKTFDGFSSRGVPLSSEVARNLLNSVYAEFSIPADQCNAGAVFRSDIDAMVLAAQEAAAQQMNLDLKEVESTRGSFEQEGGLPFNYKVSEILPREGEWIRLEAGS